MSWTRGSVHAWVWGGVDEPHCGWCASLDLPFPPQYYSHGLIMTFHHSMCTFSHRSNAETHPVFGEYSPRSTVSGCQALSVPVTLPCPRHLEPLLKWGWQPSGWHTVQMSLLQYSCRSGPRPGHAIGIEMTHVMHTRQCLGAASFPR